MTYYRPVWAEIDLRNLDYNFRLVKRIVGPKVKILVPVKAHGYGHGLVSISRRLELLGVDYLGVAGIDEGIVLRKEGIAKPILVLGSIFPEDAPAVVDYHLSQSVCTVEVARQLDREAKKRNTRVVVHIKIDTGMHRVGVNYDTAYDFIKVVSSLNNLTIEGIFTHFPCADNDQDFTRGQIKVFNCLLGRLERCGIRIPLRHTANSLGIIDYPESHFNLVRPGLMIYGLYPRDGLGRLVRLRPLLVLKTKVVHINTIPKNRGISYGHSYITSRPTRIATLSIGYGDGYPRCLSNKAHCLISGRRAKVIGRICMDQTMVDVTDIKNVAIGDEAVMIGAQGKERITVEELAELAGTIPYEIVCSLGTRIKWTYVDCDP